MIRMHRPNMVTEAATAARRNPHFVLVPFMAQGHMIPTLDMAHLLASRGRATVTFITTPVNASRNKPAIDQAKQSGLPIRFVELPFPCSEFGLPDGCESADLVLSEDLYLAFYNAASLLREPLLHHLREQKEQGQTPLTCMISDYANPWTMDVAKELHIPRLIFHGTSCFRIHCFGNIRLHGLGGAAAAPDPFIVPGLPNRIEVIKAQAPRVFDMPEFEFADDMVDEAEDSAEGVVLNSFDALESVFIESYRKTTGKGVWAIGPMFLRSNKDYVASGDTSWLDSMKPKSVVYVSFGSIVNCSYSQMVEIGLGLEATGRPFVWAVKEEEKSAEVEKWVSEMEERTKERGTIIRGWAPQVAILNHEAVGGFLTHCGWNSVLEALSAGVPMATWPHFSDQFLNEKLVVEVLGVGVKLGVKAVEVEVKREDVKMAIERLMDEGEEGEERRERARELGEKARVAMEEGGSSAKDLELLIQYVTEHDQASKDKEKHDAVYELD